MTWIAALVLFAWLCGSPVFPMGTGGRAPAEQGIISESAPHPSPQVKATVRDLLADSLKFSSREVRVQGVFKGWKGTCPSSSLFTRSDWILEDETGCIYVSGFLPSDLSPAQPNNERIVVTGRMHRYNGRLLIQATGVTKVPE